MEGERAATRRETAAIPFAGKHVDALSALWDLPRPLGAPTRACLLAHGAGAPMDVPLLEHVAERLAATGIPTLRFLYPYFERARREDRRLPPDRAPTLLAAHRAAADALRVRFPAARLLFAGKSLGGRMASLLAAEGDELDALAFLGYPLHPASKPERRRVDHFPDCAQPALFLQGERDALGAPDEVRAELPRWGGAAELHAVRGADHGFSVRKQDGRTEDEVHAEVADALVAWVGRVLPLHA